MAFLDSINLPRELNTVDLTNSCVAINNTTMVLGIPLFFNHYIVGHPHTW
jgi:hypothetical protein